MLRRIFIVAASSMVLAGSARAEVIPAEVHGFVQARTILANNNFANRIHRYGLSISSKLDEEFDLRTELYIHPTEADASTRTYVESAYLNWNLKERLPWNFSVRMGKGRNFCYGLTPSYSSRRISDYSIYSQEFTQLRVVGFQTFSDFGNFQIALAAINPYTNVSRTIPEIPLGNSLKIPLSDRDNDCAAIKKRIGLSGRIGYKLDILNVGADFYASQTGSCNVGGVKQKNNTSRLGLDAELKLGCGFVGQAQFTLATTPCDLDSAGVAFKTDKIFETALSHKGGEVLVGYEKSKCGLYARYGMLSYDDELQDMSQVMLSAVYKIRPTIHFRLEGLINDEKKDVAKKWAKVDNNVLFFETLFAW